ncbi:hypothetical protein Cadr_000023034 [Camelus dromedarius]|uniref:Uncharacterized protein n=1 Tax=Camelus dromedarius TaxID=9838 RepID=A0A5N4CIP0_CAMDR|nr:hypothetical protein Cadr_000023034 [Camelus dromedarius]
MASVNSASRTHYASSIPVPRTASQTRMQTPAASPRLQPRQAGLALRAISFSSAHQQSQPVTATVAPFQYRAQTDQEPGPLRQGSWASDGYSGPPGGTEESLSCMDPHQQATPMRPPPHSLL